jgi:rhamnopyranosyl-N-acetylglucosaminyl-diphospho-decaprenol beta-1,3/1,4-galactofuranosyltransferase
VRATNGNLVAVIVTFNRLQKLKLTLELTFTHNFYKVIVVNNCSTDGTGQWLDGLKQENLEIIHSETNGGGAGGFHQGFRHAAEKLPGADWLVCYDDDAHPESRIVDTFAALHIPADVGSMAAAVYLPDGRISEMNRPSRNPFWHFRELFQTIFKGRFGFHISNEHFQQNTEIEVDTSSFVGCYIRLSLIRTGAIGLPRSELFIYADDIIYVLESRKAGFKHLFVPTMTFTHDCQTLVNQQDVYHPLWKVYYTFRNRLEMYRIASGIFYPLVLLIKIPKCFLTARHYDKHERKKFLFITARAVWDGVFRNYSRTHEQIVALCALKPDT